jgi:ActR/RegA family two-component response regulator
MSSDRGVVLNGRRVLLAEDNFILADNLARKMSQLGLIVIGPATNVAQAMALLDAGDAAVEGAVLDIQLGREMSFPIVDKLREMDVPAVFLSGFAGDAALGAYGDVPCFRKPIDAAKVAAALFA